MNPYRNLNDLVLSLEKRLEGLSPKPEINVSHNGRSISYIFLSGEIVYAWYHEGSNYPTEFSEEFIERFGPMPEPKKPGKQKNLENAIRVLEEK